MDDKCRTCTIKCRQADHIHETALGRMYAMNKLLSYVKKVDNGVLVEVVRCKDCKYWKPGDSFSGDSLDDMQRIGGCPIMRFGRREKDFCCDGERKDND